MQLLSREWRHTTASCRNPGCNRALKTKSATGAIASRNAHASLLACEGCVDVCQHGQRDAQRQHHARGACTPGFAARASHPQCITSRWLPQQAHMPACTDSAK
jgi:hypothetical protein